MVSDGIRMYVVMALIKHAVENPNWKEEYAEVIKLHKIDVEEIERRASEAKATGHHAGAFLTEEQYNNLLNAHFEGRDQDVCETLEDITRIKPSDLKSDD